jgi:hypothetical protein
MARAFKEILGLTGDPIPRRRPHRFVPSLAESASCLEGRTLLSGAGSTAHHAAANLAETADGRRVTAMFESIMHTAPTSQQLARWVHKLHSGVSAKVLRKDLVAQVRAQQGLQASATASASIISGQSSSSASGRSTAAGSRGLPTSVRNGINSPGGSIAVSRSAVQVPGNARLSLSASSAALSRSFTFTQPVTTTTTTTTTPATTSTTSNAATTTTGTTTSTTGVSLIGTPTALTFAPLTFSPITFTPTMSILSPINASVVPANGALPFTGTPANPSPISANGTLPFTGTPFNPSPVAANGTLPFTGTPFNPSPVSTIGTVI